jgi:hypothetical protein
MQILYTARGKFDKEFSETDAWENFINWSRLYQVDQIIGLDCSLSDIAFHVDMSDEEIYHHLVIDDLYPTNLFLSLDYVVAKVNNFANTNILAVVKNPDVDCCGRQIADFDFLGYELIDYFYEHSALTNCGGFDETFLPEELNNYGLLGSYSRAKEIQAKLKVNNPEEDHAHCNLFAIWLHKLY